MEIIINSDTLISIYESGNGKVFGITKDIYYFWKGMKKKRDYYQELKKQGLTDKEIAESFILPVELSDEEKKEDLKILREYIEKSRNEKGK